MLSEEGGHADLLLSSLLIGGMNLEKAILFEMLRKRKLPVPSELKIFC
jgi:hypothetical protein